MKKHTEEEEEVERTGWASPMVEGKVLFMFFRFPINSTFPFCLIRVSLQDLSTARTDISPVLQFPVKDFPMFMRCVELDSKFYFLGGELDPGLCTVPNPNYSCYLPPEVYAVDAHTLSVVAAGDTFVHPHEVLKPVSPMNSGKPDAYPFSACGKIYVIAGSDDLLGESYDDYVEFESYDPIHDEWTVMPEVPTDELISGHAVVDREVILVTGLYNIFFFNVDTLVWRRLSTRLPSPLLEDKFVFDTKGAVVDGTLYCCCNDRPLPVVVAYCKGDDDDEAKGCFDHAALMSPETVSAYKWQVVNISHALVHLGERTFCHVTAGTAFEKYYEPGVKYLHKLGIQLTLLEVGETYKRTCQFGDEHFFRGKWLQDAFLVTPSGEDPLIQYCFLVSSVSALG